MKLRGESRLHHVMRCSRRKSSRHHWCIRILRHLGVVDMPVFPANREIERLLATTPYENIVGHHWWTAATTFRCVTHWCALSTSIDNTDYPTENHSALHGKVGRSAPWGVYVIRILTYRYDHTNYRWPLMICSGTGSVYSQYYDTYR